MYCITGNTAERVHENTNTTFHFRTAFAVECFSATQFYRTGQNQSECRRARSDNSCRTRWDDLRKLVRTKCRYFLCSFDEWRGKLYSACPRFTASEIGRASCRGRV